MQPYLSQLTEEITTAIYSMAVIIVVIGVIQIVWILNNKKRK